jgi:hypothetical protein
MKSNRIKGKGKSFKLLFFAAAAFLLLFYAFLIVSEKGGRGFFGFNRQVERVIELKLSSDDLILLNRRETTMWIRVRWIETDKKSSRVKIRPLPGSGMDFQLDIFDTVYNLYELSKSRKAAYNFFKQADSWNLRRSTPLVVQLKINAVPVGTYLMEEYYYEQLRDDQGEYFIRLNTDTHRLRKMRYEVENGRTETLQKYFNKQELAAYFVFFSLFSPDSPPAFHHLVFRFDAVEKKYHPYLTMSSIISGLDEKGTVFEKPSKAIRDSFKQLDRKNVENLLRKSRRTPYASLVGTVLTDIQTGT